MSMNFSLLLSEGGQKEPAGTQTGKKVQALWHKSGTHALWEKASEKASAHAL